jgi:dGTPase
MAACSYDLPAAIVEYCRDHDLELRAAMCIAGRRHGSRRWLTDIAYSNHDIVDGLRAGFWNFG